MKAIPLNENNYKSRPALRLIGTKELSREDWFAVRKQGIGSSHAGAAVGLTLVTERKRFHSRQWETHN